MTAAWTLDVYGVASCGESRAWIADGRLEVRLVGEQSLPVEVVTWMVNRWSPEFEVNVGSLHRAAVEMLSDATKAPPG